MFVVLGKITAQNIQRPVLQILKMFQTIEEARSELDRLENYRDPFIFYNDLVIVRWEIVT